MEELRRVGAHYVLTESGTLQQCVVEIMDDRVVNYYTFTGMAGRHHRVAARGRGHAPSLARWKSNQTNIIKKRIC